jgi:predicted outer membrane repeat protein
MRKAMPINRNMLTRLLSKAPQIVLISILILIGAMPARNSVLAASSIQAPGTAHVDSNAWYDGSIQYSTITNCVSIIQGAPYQEYGAGTYVGFLADPDNGLPSPNTVYYIHVVIAGLGNACSGMRAYIDLGLPPNTSLAIDNTYPVYCFYNGQPIDPPSECPQVLPPSSYNPGYYDIPSPDGAHAYTWPIPQGAFLEIQVPIKSSTALTNAALVGKVWMLDGNDSPWLQPQQGVYVFDTQPSILYPSPSTTSIKDTTAYSEAYLYTHGLGGTGYFDLGTDTNYGLIHESVVIPAGGNAFLAWDNWGPPPLTPDTLYHWRFTFTPSSGSPVYGVDQTFKTMPSGVAVVGSGATGSCNEAALLAALGTGQPNITFACGPLPATITLSSAISIVSVITIDGGNMVALNNSGSNHFDVQSGAHLTLTQIALNDGFSATCGGAIHVLAGGQLTLNKTTFNNNLAYESGGAVCIDASASADIHFSTFTNNQSSGGGAVFNAGTLVMDFSRLVTNSSGSMGGAVQNYGTGSVNDTSFVENTAAVNGGGIDAGGILSIIRGTFTSNTAGVRGGGINVYGGNLSVTESSFITNHSSGYGGGIANDASTLTIQTSEFSGNTAVSVGGGLRSNGATLIINSTFSGNHSDGTGGGIDNSDTSSSPDTLSLLNTTLVGNTAGSDGGNLFLGSVSSANVELKNTLIASGAPNNCDKTVTSQGHNLESTNTCGLAAAGDLVNAAPRLGPLQNNGGFTRTHALSFGSPAIDAGTNTGCPAIDQRGTTRPLDGNHDGTATCDIGSYEYVFGATIPSYLPLLRR